MIEMSAVFIVVCSSGNEEQHRWSWCPTFSYDFSVFLPVWSPGNLLAHPIYLEAFTPPFVDRIFFTATH